jgi:hypothetical protein
VSLCSPVRREAAIYKGCMWAKTVSVREGARRQMERPEPFVMLDSLASAVVRPLVRHERCVDLNLAFVHAARTLIVLRRFRATPWA